VCGDQVHQVLIETSYECSVKSVVPVVIPFRCVPRSSLILRSKREAHQNDLWIGSVVFVALAAGSTRQMCRRESLRAQQSTMKFLCSMRSCVAQWNAALLTRLYIRLRRTGTRSCRLRSGMR
jgi:hypothetical protein